MKIYNRIILFFLCVTAAVAVYAESPTMSPYSKFGYGMLNDNATSAQKAMGGVGYALNNGRQINAMNPASYAAMDSLTFLWDVGATCSNLWSREQGVDGKANTSSSTGGGLDYITMQFPITKWMGASVGLVPFTSVGYSFGKEVSHGISSHSGFGGLNQLYLGLSARPFNNFTVGANIGYIWGHTVNDVYATTNAGTTSLFERVVRVRDYNLTLGIQYDIDINENNKLTLGVVYNPEKRIHGKTWGAYYDMDSDSDPDTVGYQRLGKNYSMPNTFGGGVAYVFQKRFTAALDFTYQDWSNAKFGTIEGFEETKFDNRWKLAAGVEYMHNPRGNYWQRIAFRCGGYYNHDYINVKDNNVREFGVAVGFGLPTPSTKTVINIGFEYKHRATTPADLITEDYFNITLGINFNEMWFWKNKIQ